MRPLAPGPHGPDDPKQRHGYLETDDPGIAAAASGSGTYQGNLANTWAVTTAFLRGTRCAVPGCGKERHDPVHGRSPD